MKIIAMSVYGQVHPAKMCKPFLVVPAVALRVWGECTAAVSVPTIVRACLQGANFIAGAEANALAAKKIYPGWVLRVYTSSGASVAARLRAAGAEVRLKTVGGIRRPD